MSVKSYNSRNFCSISQNDTSKTVQINQLPLMKNPFLVIAYPSSLLVKDRKTYCFETFNDNFIRQQTALMPNFQQKLKKVDLQEDLQGQVDEQQNGLIQVKSIQNNFVSKSASNQCFDDILSQIQFENKNQSIQHAQKIKRKNIQSSQLYQQNHLNSQKKRGTIVKNLYKRNRLSNFPQILVIPDIYRQKSTNMI